MSDRGFLENAEGAGGGAGDDSGIDVLCCCVAVLQSLVESLVEEERRGQVKAGRARARNIEKNFLRNFL